MPGKKSGPSIKWPELYEKLISQGKSKESAARISNAAWRKKRAKKIKKHSPGGQEHNQELHGSWSRGASAQQILERTRREEGSTQRIDTGNQPKRGFSIGISKFSSGAIANGGKHHIRAFIQSRFEELTANPRRHLGTWINPSNGEMWLDVVEVFDNSEDYRVAFDDAVEFGLSDGTEEIAMYDLNSGNTINMTPGDIEAYRARLQPDGSFEP